MGISEDGQLPISRERERAAARARPPHIQVHDAEQFRRDVLQHVDVLARLDVTAGERAETAEWRQRIEAAPANRVWVEYQRQSITNGHDRASGDHQPEGTKWLPSSGCY